MENCHEKGKTGGRVLGGRKGQATTEDVKINEKPHHLVCLYTNANSVIGKMNELRQRVATGNFDIVGITETFAHPGVEDAELGLEGYNLFRKDRHEQKGGGVALYIRDSISATLHTMLSKSKFEESIWCTVKGDKTEVLVGLVYRSPSSTEANNCKLLNDIHMAADLCKDRQLLLLMGDFNFPEINYRVNQVSAGSGSASEIFYTTTEDLFLTQYVEEPTRVRDHNKPSILDYIFTNEEDLIEEKIAYETPLGKSDHVVLTWKTTISATATDSKQKKHNYWKGNYRAINAALSTVDWEAEMSDKSVNEKWQLFKDIMSHLIIEFIPIKKNGRRKKNCWITKETLEEMRLRNAAWRDYRANTCKSKYRIYTQIRNRANKMVHSDKEAFNQKILDSFKGNPKKFYGYMRSLKTVKAQVTQLSKKDGTLTEDDKQAAELLCDYFEEVFTKELDKADQSQVTEILGTNNPVIFDARSVKQRLQKLNADKSPGPDGLHPLILKECAENIAIPLSIIYQASYDNGVLPEDWRLAEVMPIYKKGPKNDPGNYRPVSLTSVPCKIMEGILRDQLLEHLEARNLINVKQHGFLRGRSCLTNLLETFEEWTKALDEGYGIDVVYLDYRKAFDTVPHGRLSRKLASYGIDGKLQKWIADFLTRRKMRVNVKGSFSQWGEVCSGVPQGSVLGPILFLLYVNDIPQWMANSIRLFADDTKVWKKIREPGDASGLQDDLDQLQKWSDEWLLKFNTGKCKVMHVGHKNPTKYYLYENGIPVELQETKEEKDLGIIVTHDLKPSKQCIAAAAKGRSVLGMINRHFKRLSRDQFLSIYKTYVRPHLEYCIQAWSPWLRKDIDVLEKVQRRATRMVTGMKKLNYNQRLKRLNLTTLEERRHRGDLIQTYKLLNHKDNIDYQQFFQMEQSKYGLRGHESKLFVPGIRTNTRKNFFSYRVLSAWNRLSQETVDADTVNCFKTRIDKNIKDMGI